MSAQPHVHDHDAPDGLVSVEDARERVLDGVQPLSPIRLPLTEAHGGVTAEDVGAGGVAAGAPPGGGGAPPAAPRELAIVGRALIGQEPEGTVGAGEAMRIAT